MKKIFLNERGFTLIEAVASIIILAIMGALVLISTTKIIEGFIFTKMNAETSQKGHIAMNRLTKEFTNIISVATDTSTTNDKEIDFISTSYIDGGTQTVTVSWGGSSGNPLLLNNTDILVDNVMDFELKYYDSYDDTSPEEFWSATTSTEIGITLSLVGANDVVSTFISRVTPRNL